MSRCSSSNFELGGAKVAEIDEVELEHEDEEATDVGLLW